MYRFGGGRSGESREVHTTMSLDTIRGRIADIDSHESIPMALWPEHFGPLGAAMQFENSGEQLHPNDPSQPIDISAGEPGLDEETVWTAKGVHAPGSIDFARRLDVLDVMGVERQLLFPLFGVTSIVLTSASPATAREKLGVDMPEPQQRAVARQVSEAHNEWAIRQTKAMGGRIRPVATLLTEDLDQMLADAQRLIDAGVRALWIPSASPPAGRSPADPALDAFWSLCAASDVPVVLHLGGEFDFMRSDVWSRAPGLDRHFRELLEVTLDPYSLATLHLSTENFLTTMLLGGVFERHPKLRFGVIENNIGWVGPMMEMCDFAAEKAPFLRHEGIISDRPSEYVKRNVRVSVLSPQRADKELNRFDLEDVLCYSSDYPHVEGGRWALQRFYDQIAPLGPTVVEKFFVENGRWLMPD